MAASAATKEQHRQDGINGHFSVNQIVPKVSEDLLDRTLGFQLLVLNRKIPHLIAALYGKRMRRIQFAGQTEMNSGSKTHGPICESCIPIARSGIWRFTSKVRPTRYALLPSSMCSSQQIAAGNVRQTHDRQPPVQFPRRAGTIERPGFQLPAPR
jgi:hypothetical protein